MEQEQPTAEEMGITPEEQSINPEEQKNLSLAELEQIAEAYKNLFIQPVDAPSNEQLEEWTSLINKYQEKRGIENAITPEDRQAIFERINQEIQAYNNDSAMMEIGQKWQEREAQKVEIAELQEVALAFDQLYIHPTEAKGSSLEEFTTLVNRYLDKTGESLPIDPEGRQKLYAEIQERINSLKNS